MSQLAIPQLQANLVHCVVVVPQDSPQIPCNNAKTFSSFLSDAAEDLGAKQLAAGVCDDHVHMLLSIPPAIAVSTVVDEVKTMSERWLRATFDCGSFRWQDGYTTFSVGISQVRETSAYIERQLECHRRIDLEKELALFREAYESSLLPSSHH